MTKAKYATEKEIKESSESDFKALEKIAKEFQYPEPVDTDSEISYFITGIPETYSTSCHYKKE